MCVEASFDLDHGISGSGEVMFIGDLTRSTCVLQTAAASKFAGDLLDTLLATHQSQQQAQHLLNATALQHTPPQTVVFFVGKQVSSCVLCPTDNNPMYHLHDAHPPVLLYVQVSTADLGEPSAADAMRPLHAAVEAAGSSLSLPYVLHKVSGALPLTWTMSGDAQSNTAVLPACLESPYAHAGRPGRASARWWQRT